MAILKDDTTVGFTPPPLFLNPDVQKAFQSEAQRKQQQQMLIMLLIVAFIFFISRSNRD